MTGNILMANISWLLILAAFSAQAARFEGEVRDQDGNPVAGAVIVANPVDGMGGGPVAKPPMAALDQRNKEFIPHVLAVRKGTEVSFPNNDKIRHHVYSFSPAKHFEIKLYKDVPPNPVLFDTEGVAVLGCNIHDWMISYVYVTGSPYFTQTGSNGHWALEAPSAQYRIGIWHPHMAGETQLSEPVTVQEGQTAYLTRSITLKRKYPSGKPPASLQDEGYNGEP